MNTVQCTINIKFLKLEKLQVENAEEWTKREQLETEKLLLERENKKLRCDLELLQEELNRKTQQMAATLDCDLRSLQLEMVERTKVIKCTFFALLN